MICDPVQPAGTYELVVGGEPGAWWVKLGESVSAAQRRRPPTVLSARVQLQRRRRPGDDDLGWQDEGPPVELPPDSGGRRGTVSAADGWIGRALVTVLETRSTASGEGDTARVVYADTVTLARPTR